MSDKCTAVKIDDSGKVQINFPEVKRLKIIDYKVVFCAEGLPVFEDMCKNMILEGFEPYGNMVIRVDDIDMNGFNFRGRIFFQVFIKYEQP